MRFFHINITILLLVFAFTGHGQATVLGDAASGLQPGSWVELQTTGLTPGLFEVGRQFITQYTEDAKWDPATEQVLFFGQGHYESNRFIAYDAATNAWRSEGSLPFSMGHAYDHTVIVPERREMYHRPMWSTTLRKYNIDSETWSGTLPDVPGNLFTYVQCCGSVEYFPEMNGIVFVNGGDGNVVFYSFDTNSWSSLATGLTMGTHHQLAEYNPVHKTVLFGGGNNGGHSIYKLDSTGAITPLNDSPVWIGIGSAILTADPGSGKYLLFGDNEVFYEYDIISDTWVLQAERPPIFNWTRYSEDVFAMVEAPIAEYGVNMFIIYNASNPKVFLYKHLPGTAHADPRPGNQTKAGPDLISAFPNPFHAEICVQWNGGAGASAPAAMGEILDIRGTRIGTFRGEAFGPAWRFTWNAEKHPGGVYFIRIKAGDAFLSKKIMLY